MRAVHNAHCLGDELACFLSSGGVFCHGYSPDLCCLLWAGLCVVELPCFRERTQQINLPLQNAPQIILFEQRFLDWVGVKIRNWFTQSRIVTGRFLMRCRFLRLRIEHRIVPLPCPIRVHAQSKDQPRALAPCAFAFRGCQSEGTAPAHSLRIFCR